MRELLADYLSKLTFRGTALTITLGRQHKFAGRDDHIWYIGLTTNLHNRLYQS